MFPPIVIILILVILHAYHNELFDLLLPTRLNVALDLSAILRQLPTISSALSIPGVFFGIVVLQIIMALLVSESKLTIWSVILCYYECASGFLSQIGSYHDVDWFRCEDLLDALFFFFFSLAVPNFVLLGV
ncbi:hypothetical protein ACJX0J_007355 [Zea mays]